MSVTGPKLPVTLVDYDGQPTGTTLNPLVTSGGGGGGGGGAVTVANGADTAQGSTTDAAVTDPSLAATVIALLKGLLTFLRVSAAGLGKAEDAPHVSGDTGVQMLGVRNDAGTALAADGDYMPPTFDAAGRLRTVVSGGASGGTSTADDSAFTVGVDSVTPAGALFDDSSPDSVDEGDVGAVRMSGNRALHVELRDAAGNERGVNINASNQMSVVGPLTDTELRATAVPVSAAALPLPTGAATEATLAAASAKLPATLGQKAMANSLAVVVASDQSAVPVTGPLTDAQLRATAVPVSLGSVPLPTGAATEASLLLVSNTMPTGVGQKNKTLSFPVTLASNEDLLSLLGALNEAAPASDTASAGLNGRLQRIAQNITSLIAQLPATLGQKLMAASLPVVIASDQSAIPISGTITATPTGTQAISVADGADVTQGALADAGVTTDAAGSLSAKLRGLVILVVNLLSRWPASLGQKTMAASFPVVIASDQSAVPVSGTVTANVSGTMEVTNDAGNPLPVSAASLPLPTGAATETTLAAQAALLGAVTETAPASDTASSGLNGRLQRIAQRITSLIALIPAALGQGTMAQSFRVVVASDQSAVPVSTTALVPGTAATNLGKAEDAVHASGDVGVMALGVRQDTPTALAAAGDYVPPTFGANNELFAGLATRLDAVNDFISAVPASSLKTTYRIAVVGLAPAVTATNILELKGSASKTVKITKVIISAVATAAGAYALVIRKQSAADSGGTSSVPTIVPLDSNNAAATATVKQYSANPTVGTLVGNVAARRGTVSTAAGAIPNVPTEFKFGESVGQELVLRGVAQGMAISLEGVTMTGGLIDIELEFTEE